MFLCSTVNAAEFLPDRTLTLDDSVKLALNNSQSVLSSREDETIALQRVRESESLFFPKLDLNANWSKFRVEGATPLMLQPALGPTLVPDSPRQNFYTARANIYQTVYEGGRSRNVWRQARISYERARSIQESLTQQVTGNAKTAYYDLLFAQERVRGTQQAMDTVKKMIPQSESLSINDRIQLESELSQLRADVAAAKLKEGEVELAYLHTLNLELNTTVLLKGELSTNPVELDLQKMLAWATQYRTELRQTEYQEELDALGINLSLAERTPTVAFGASYERSGNDLDVLTSNWAGTLNVNLPVSISDFVYGWAKVKERRAQYRQATLKHVETADQIQWQVRQAYLRYRYWQDELASREQDMRRMQSLVDSARREKGRLVERVKAERLWLDNQLRYKEAVHGQLVALATLERAVGHSLDNN